MIVFIVRLINKAGSKMEIQTPLTYAQFAPEYYTGLCKGFASQLDNANDWLTHVLMVQQQRPLMDCTVMINDAIATVNDQVARYLDTIERLNKPIKK